MDFENTSFREVVIDPIVAPTGIGFLNKHVVSHLNAPSQIVFLSESDTNWSQLLFSTDGLIRFDSIIGMGFCYTSRRNRSGSNSDILTNPVYRTLREVVGSDAIAAGDHLLITHRGLKLIAMLAAWPLPRFVA